MADPGSHVASAVEFEGWVSKGLGRAVLYLQDHNGEPFREAILNACIRDVAYDRQCEGIRREYLKDLIRVLGQEDFIRNGLLRTLSAAEAGTDEIDLEQTVAVAGLFAERGDAQIKVAMYEAVGKVGLEQGSDCYDTLIALDGVEALGFASRQLPSQPGDEDRWIVDQMLATLEARDGRKEARKAVLDLSHQLPQLKLFVDRIGKVDLRTPFIDEFAGLEYRSLRSMIQSDTKLRQLSRWGQSASMQDLQAASDDLVIESEQNRLLSYLSVFRKQKFSGSIDRLIQLAESDIGRVSRAAISVLSSISDPRIRDLLLRMVESEEKRGSALELMASNLEEGDFVQIERMLRDANDTHCIHSIGIGLRHLVKVRTVPESVASLLYVYENGPCSLCRSEIVEFLVALNAVPEWMREECRFDADIDTRLAVFRG